MRRFRVVAVAVLALVLAACGSIPLGTMWKMYRMGPGALYETDPEQVRVAVMSEDWVLNGERFDWGVFTVDLELNESGTYSYKFILDDVSRLELAKLKSAPRDRRWRVYRITPEDLEAFQAMQAELSTVQARIDEGESGSLQLGVYFMGGRDREIWRNAIEDDTITYKSEDPADPAEREQLDQREIPYRIDLQLKAEDGFFTLIKESTIRASWLDNDKAESEAGSP